MRLRLHHRYHLDERVLTPWSAIAELLTALHHTPVLRIVNDLPNGAPKPAGRYYLRPEAAGGWATPDLRGSR